MAVHPNHSNQLYYLTRIESYCKQTIKDTNTFETTTIWVARVPFYDADDCKVWFGGPTQVWCKSLQPDSYFMLSSIKSRVAYCEAVVDFGRIIRKQNALVVSLQTNFGS